ncbi:hypothetical protein GFS24_04135 [Chitinophaga sp. SYP-B3965]|uniref:hypothetical protein n=1 Tax=Chitinophaga sp. SYP-B3965 TaxID=2663120 RepID=UPI001299A060|nr:hypothetical protein [Chitinophaga sp. SYP-B3965]MRG44287.1 hypothetical protein [Chitinophaga sp. SYP-B3965]
MKQFICLTAVMLMLFAVSCIRRTGQSTAFTVSQDISSPGDIILLQFSDTTEVDTSGMEMTFGKEAAFISGQGPQGAIAVMVPDIPSGKVKLSVSRKGKLLGESDFTIQDNPAKSIALSMQGKEFKVLASKGTNNPVEQYLGTEGRMLAFDVLDAKGELVMTGTVPHPGAMEVFTAPKVIHREEMHEHMPSFFSITIPNAKGKLTIKFYEPDSKVSITSGNFSSARKLISEITFNN